MGRPFLVFAIALMLALCVAPPRIASAADDAGENGGSIFDPDGASAPPRPSKTPAPKPTAPPKSTPKPIPAKVDPPQPAAPKPVPPPKPTPAPTRLPIPAEADITTLQAIIREAYKADYATRDHAVADALVKKLMQQSDKPGASVVDRYVLLCEARDVAARNGDLTSARIAIGKLSQAYRAGREKMSLDMLDLAAKSPAASMGEVTEAYLALSDDFSDTDDFDSALKAATRATTGASRARDAVLATRAKRQAKILTDLKRQRDLADAARTTLLLKPEDPDANLTLGRYLCSRDQWADGLKRLSNSADAESKRLAEADLASPESPDDMFALATRWWTFGVHKSDALPTIDARRRATHWYGRAIPGLKGLAKSAAQARIVEATAGLEFANVTVNKYVPERAGDAPAALFGMSDPTIPDELFVRAEPKRIRVSGSKDTANAVVDGRTIERYGKAVMVQHMRFASGDITLGMSMGGDNVRYDALLQNQSGQVISQPLDLVEGTPVHWSVAEEGEDVRLTVSSDQKVFAALSMPAKDLKAFGFAASFIAVKDKAEFDVSLGTNSK